MEDKLAQHLHDQATCGGTLTGTEQSALEAWYERQDRQEAAQLAASASPSLESLRTEVSDALMQLNDVIQRIRNQSDENEALRQEVTALSQRLIYTAPLKAA